MPTMPRWLLAELKAAGGRRWRRRGGDRRRPDPGLRGRMVRQAGRPGRQARAQLSALRGRRHTLVTAVLCRRGGERVGGMSRTPTLTMRRVRRAFLDAYLAAEGEAGARHRRGLPAGGVGRASVRAVEGEHAAVLGLPLLPLLGFLRQHGAVAPDLLPPAPDQQAVGEPGIGDGHRNVVLSEERAVARIRRSRPERPCCASQPPGGSIRRGSNS